jgi:hypothetical protein
MSTEEDWRQGSASLTNGSASSSDTAEMSLDLTVNDTQILEDEIERLRQRVEDLELTVVDYRNQMTQIVTSASWKFTKPIRSGAAHLPGWDNTAPRSQDAYVFHGAYGITWARHIRTAMTQNEGNTLFINAWNEYTEGATWEGSSTKARGFIETLTVTL